MGDGENFLKVEPALRSEVHVQHETGRGSIGVDRGEELARRGERLDGQALGAQEARERTPNGRVVVDDRDPLSPSHRAASRPNLKLIHIRRSCHDDGVVPNEGNVDRLLHATSDFVRSLAGGAPLLVVR